MELTLNQALQKGIEAHRAGQVQEADQYYTAILKAQPKHPDANHNMGVLAVGVGKVQEALPFFKIALEANPSVAQYWLSYIDALVKLDRIADAKTVFDQAKSNGAKGDGFDVLEQLINEPQIEGDQTDEEILGKAIDLRETGKYDEAIDVLLKQIKRSSTDPNILSLLSHCYILTDNLEQSKIYLGAAKDINPNIASIGWTETRLLLKQKKVDEALVVADKTNKLFPDDVEGICVLGSCLRANGNFDESLKYLNQAIEINPNYAEALIHRGLIYLTKNDKSNALTDLEKAHHLKPHIKQIWDLLISLIVEAKNYTTAISVLIKMIDIDPDHEKNYSILALCNQEVDDPALAIESFEKILEIRPNDAVMHLNLGLAFKKQNESSKAIENYKKAISIKPDFAEAYNGMGNVLLEQGKLEEAIELYSKALSIKPSYADAYNNMGNALKDQGKLNEAIEAYKTAISLKPDYAKAYNNLSLILRGMVFNKPNRGLQKIIISLLDKKTSVRPKDIAKAAISLLKFDPSLLKHLQLADNEVIESPLDVISDLSELPLLLKLMSVCPLPDLGLEKLLTKLRFSVLSNILSLNEAPPQLTAFQSALALQCFTNEYIYNHTVEEEKILQSLDYSIKKALKNKEQLNPQVILALASYKALNQYDWCKLLVVTDDIKEVYSRQIEEPNHEEKLKQDLPVLEEITDKISSKVREQYEESPYPRWVNLQLPLKPMSISKVVYAIKLKLHDNKITEVDKPEILIAGCGTGQHSIGTAARFKSSKVLAIDLSLSSLAYAKRKTDELAIENIEYVQADILDLGQLNKQFDIIESGGVLHHMEYPMAGWKVLKDRLKPGGLMKIGLYSELARQHIVKIRKEISNAGIGSSDEDMKSFRDILLKSDKDHHKLVTGSADFYSLSTLKDLLFHVQEHRFTIPQIKDYLNKIGLKFCGFESKRIVSHFKQTTKAKYDLYDFDKWQSYEEANPNVFAGMYQFWCQKAE